MKLFLNLHSDLDSLIKLLYYISKSRLFEFLVTSDMDSLLSSIYHCMKLQFHFDFLKSLFMTFKRGIYILFAVSLSGILKAKQKLGITFNSDKLGGIDFTKI